MMDKKKKDIRCHCLTIRTEFLDNILIGRKDFEVRKNDRDYQVGDELFFHEVKDGKYTDRIITANIKYIHTGLGMAKDYVILGLCDIEKN